MYATRLPPNYYFSAVISSFLRLQQGNITPGTCYRCDTVRSWKLQILILRRDAGTAGSANSDAPANNSTSVCWCPGHSATWISPWLEYTIYPCRWKTVLRKTTTTTLYWLHEIPRTLARNPGLSELILYASANLPTWTASPFPFPTPWIPYYPIPETCPWNLKWNHMLLGQQLARKRDSDEETDSLSRQ